MVTVTLRYCLGQVKTGKESAHGSCYTFHFRDRNVYKHPDTTLFGKSVEMKVCSLAFVTWNSKIILPFLTRLARDTNG